MLFGRRGRREDQKSMLVLVSSWVSRELELYLVLNQNIEGDGDVKVKKTERQNAIWIGLGIFHEWKWNDFYCSLIAL